MSNTCCWWRRASYLLEEEDHLHPFWPQRCRTPWLTRRTFWRSGQTFSKFWKIDALVILDENMFLHKMDRIRYEMRAQIAATYSSHEWRAAILFPIKIGYSWFVESYGVWRLRLRSNASRLHNELFRYLLWILIWLFPSNWNKHETLSSSCGGIFGNKKHFCQAQSSR